MYSMVIKPKPANSKEALAHFQSLLSFETDCADVHYAMNNNLHDFVLLDVRAIEVAKQGYIKGAIFMPHAKINQDNLSQYPEDTIFIVYCAGPHCNATEKAAIKLARLGHPVKKMVGGVVGWLDEGFDLIIDT